MNNGGYGYSFNNPGFMAFNTPPDPRMRELELQYRSKNDPNRPPRRKPGDGYTITGFILGLISGGIIGNVIGNFRLFIGLILGGGSGGSFFSSYVHRLIKKSKEPKNEPEKDKGSQGPFV